MTEATAAYSRIVLAERPTARPGPEHFRLETVPLPAPADGEVVIRTVYLSLDPYMRGRMSAAKSYAKAVEIGETMEGEAVGVVVESRSPKLAIGDIVRGKIGWASHGVLPAGEVRRVDPAVAPISTALGVLGMPGLTAYVGFNDLGRPKAGETIVVSAATGAVGSMVGQLARLKGLKVVGVAGGARKCAYAMDELGYDACVDHQGDDLAGRLAAACPNGVDIYYENVGGQTLEAVIGLMNVGGRIPVCGTVAWYNTGAAAAEGPNRLPLVWRSILVKRLTVQGLIVLDHWHRTPDFVAEVGPLVRDGKIRYRETIAEGLASAPAAFIGLLEGENFGKQLVRVSPDPTA